MRGESQLGPQRLEHCPCCNTGMMTAHWRGTGFSKCPSCHFLVRDPLPTDEELAELYREGWRHPLRHTRETGGTTAALARVYSVQLMKSLGLTDLAGQTILDFGAGRGEMMAALAELGADVYGVEPFGGEFLAHEGWKVFRGLRDLPQPLRVDGIVSLDVIEHLSTPWTAVRHLQELLKPGGWMFVATPNADGARARVLRSRYSEVRNPLHLALFTPAALERIFLSCGFARYRRLKWFVQYRRHPLRRLVHGLLQFTGLDGELRYLARKE